VAPEQLLADAPTDLAHRVALLVELADRLSRAFSRDEVVATATRLVAASCGLDHLQVAVLGDGNAPGPTAVGAAADNGELIYEPDLRHSKYPDLAALSDRGLASALVVPMRTQDQAIGALVAARTGTGFAGHDLLTLDQAAAVVAAAVELLRSSEVAQRAEVDRHKAAMVAERRRDELTALELMAAALERFELAHALAVMADELAGLRGIELARIALVGPDGGLVEVATGSRFGARLPEIDAASPDRLAAASADLVLWRRPDPSDLIAVDGLCHLGVTSLFALPVPWHDQVIGTILAGSTGGHRLVTDEHLVVADVAGQLLVESIDRRHGIEAFHRLASRAG
jgi:GAF domain